MEISWRTIASNIISLIVGSFVSQFAAFLALILITRQVGPVQYGEYTSSITLVTFSAILYNLGLDVWLLKEGGAFPEKIGEIAGSLFFIRLGIGFLSLNLWYLATLVLPLAPLEIHLFRVNAWIVWFNSLLGILLTTFKAGLKSRFAAAFDISLNVAVLIATIMLAFSGSKQIYEYLDVRIILIAIGLIMVVWVSNRTFQLRVNLNTAVDVIKQSLPYASSELLVMLYMRLDVLLVAYFLNERSTGLYSSAIGIMNVLFLIPAAISVVMIPTLSRQFQTQPNKAWQTTGRMMGVLLAVGLFLMLFMTFGSESVEILLGPSYAESKDIFRQLSPIVLLQSCSYGLSAILAANNLQSKRSIIQVAAVVLDAGLNIWFLPHIGIPAAIYAFTFSSLVLVIGYSLVNYRQYYRMKFAG